MYLKHQLKTLLNVLRCASWKAFPNSVWERGKYVDLSIFFFTLTPIIVTFCFYLLSFLGWISKVFCDRKKHASNSRKKLTCPKIKGTFSDRVQAKAKRSGNLATVAVISSP